MPKDKRKRADDQQNSGPLKKSKPVIDNLELLNCEICFELPRAEVYQCSNGHSVCSKCIVNLKKCPTCNVPYQTADDQGTGKIRNHFAEKILSTVRFNCFWREQGCDQEGLTGQQVTEHEGQCSFNPNPIKLCGMLFSNACGYGVSRKFLRNPVLDIPANLQDHLRAAHFSSTPVRRTIFTGSVSSEKYNMESFFDNKFALQYSSFIQLRDASSKNPLGIYMVWAYNYLLRSEVKQMSWFLVRVTDQPKSSSVRVKFTLKSSTTPEDDGVLNCETSWDGEIMSLHEFFEFRNAPFAKRDELKFAIPFSHLQRQYLNAAGGVDLQYVFTVSHNANKEVADSSSNNST